MSIVKYTNKKTGVITLYESTSHYDPETKQSRPIRKYLGKEDPVTGELIPSSGKRGRKKELTKADGNASIHSDDDAIPILKARYEKAISERDATIKAQAVMIKKLEAQREAITKKLSVLLRELSD